MALIASGTDDHHRAEAQDEGQQVEEPDEGGGVADRGPRGAGVRHGVEAHQDVREARGAEHEGEAERERVERVRHELPRPEHLAAEPVGGGGEEGEGVAAEAGQDEAGQDGGPADQQDRLHDLHPGGREHAAEEHVGHHHDADDHDGRLVGDPEEELDEVPGADHLGDQVEGHDGERPEGGRDADRDLPEPEGDHVGEGVAAEVAQRLGDQEHHDGPPDQEADRVDEAVEPGQGHEARDPEEAGRAHVVAGEGEAVLQAGHGAAGRVEVLGAHRAAGGPEGDPEGHRHEEEEPEDGGRVGLAEARRHFPGSRIEATVRS